MFKKCASVVLVVFAMAVIPSGAMGQKGNPAVIPPNAKYKGLTYSEWDARWWQAAFQLPVIDGYHPNAFGGPIGEVDGVLFLAGAFGAAAPADPTEFDITIGPGTAILVPLVNLECSMLEPPPFHGDDEEELRDCANELLDLVYDLFAILDGVEQTNLTVYRTDSPLFEIGPLPEDNLFAFFGVDAPEGTTTLAVGAGYYLLIKPLSVGHHTLHYGGTIGDPFNAAINTQYNITVKP